MGAVGARMIRPPGADSAATTVGAGLPSARALSAVSEDSIARLHAGNSPSRSRLALSGAGATTTSASDSFAAADTSAAPSICTCSMSFVFTCENIP